MHFVRRPRITAQPHGLARDAGSPGSLLRMRVLFRLLRRRTGSENCRPGQHTGTGRSLAPPAPTWPPNPGRPQTAGRRNGRRALDDNRIGVLSLRPAIAIEAVVTLSLVKHCGRRILGRPVEAGASLFRPRSGRPCDSRRVYLVSPLRAARRLRRELAKLWLDPSAQRHQGA